MATPASAATTTSLDRRAHTPYGPVRRWLLAGLTGRSQQHDGPHVEAPEHRKHSWWRVMCLTGVDYFSTLGYQPGIAALAAGVLSPIATLVLIAVTLLGALPVYRRVAEESPHGEGSIAMLERLLSFWKGKLFVLVLLGFAATDFLITMTLSAADATAHIDENPFWPDAFQHHEVLVTLILLAALGAVFLKGFTEAIGIAVVLVVIYLGLNVVVIGVGLWDVVTNPSVNWARKPRKRATQRRSVARIGCTFPRLIGTTSVARPISNTSATVVPPRANPLQTTPLMTAKLAYGRSSEVEVTTYSPRTRS